MFKNAKIRTRLLYGYLVIILLTAVITALAIFNFQNLVGKAESTNRFITYPTGELVNFSIPYGNVRSAMRDIAATTDPAENDKQKKAMESNWALMMTAFEAYEALVEKNRDTVIPEEYEAIKAISAALVPYKDALFNKLIPAAVANDNEEAIRVRKVDLVPPGNIIRDNINYLVALNIQQSEDSLVEMKAIQTTTIRDSIILMVAVVVLVVLLAYLIVKSITQPVRQMILASEAMAKGALTFNLSYQAKDEIGILSNNFRKVAESINLLLQEINDMSDAMDKGDTDKRINTAYFEGSYKHVAQGVNNMMINTLSETNQFIECMTQFSNGDFNADMAPLPGKKAVMNQNLNNMRTNLKAINQEINKFVGHATQGQLSFRVDAHKYGGDWAKILVNLNSLMEVVSAPIDEAKIVLSDVAIGNFHKKMSGRYDGDFRIIKDSINSTIENIESYIAEITNVLTGLSNKNLNQSIERAYVGGFSTIKDAINNITVILSGIINDIYSASANVTQSATQISQSSMSLAQSASVQAASTEELNASITVINDSTARNAESAEEAVALTESAKNNAANGNKDMQEMLVSMESIKDSSNSISKIIKVIEDIAFQTNLLALNAAVEAARAGEHGKGFAVVAEEVRNLSARSQNAANETAELIEESISRVNQGAKIANQTAVTLHAIVNDISKIADIVSNISALSQKQTLSINEITTDINRMTEITENVSSSSQESAAASETLSNQAHMLQNLVDDFNLKK